MPNPTPYGPTPDILARLAVLETTMTATARHLERLENEMDTRFEGIAHRLEAALAEMRQGAADGRKVLIGILAGVIGTLITTIVGILIATA